MPGAIGARHCGKERPATPSNIKGTRRPPDVTATWPNARHGVTTFTASSWNRRRNSLLEPWVDVRADLDAINAGGGVYDLATRRVWVDGRLYGIHEHGTTFPIEGDGIIPVGRGACRALAQRIWRMREEAQGHALDDRN